MEPGADRRALAGGLPGQPTLACVPRDDLPGAASRGKGGLSRQLTARLRTGRPLRKRRRQPCERRIRFIAPALLIDHRPPVAADRTRIGVWEGDLITGRMNQSAIATLVDRSSRYVHLVHLPADHGAEAVRDGLAAWLAGLRRPRNCGADREAERAGRAAVAQAA